MGVREINPILQKKAKEELGEGARDVNEDLALIRDWAAKQPHLQSINLSDQWLISFLRGCKFSLEKTKGKLETFYTMRSLFPQFVTKLDPMSPVMQDLLSRGICLPLPRTKNPDDPHVVLMRMRVADSNNTPDDDLTRFTQLIILNGLMNVDQMVVAGLRLIYDVSKYNVDLNIALNVERAKRNMAFNLKALPIRFKGVHLINTSSNTEMIINFAKKFLGEKHNKMFHIHKTLEDLHEHVPRSILPAEYGGDGPTIKELTDKLKKEVEASRDFYLQEEKYKTDESRRPGSPTTLDAILHGTDGSFRQLAVD